MEFISKVSCVLIFLASSQLQGAVPPLPQCSHSSFIPDFAWQKSLNDDEAQRFTSKEHFLPSRLYVGELILWHSNKGSWNFAQVQEIAADGIHCWRYNSNDEKDELVTKPFHPLTFHKLSPFWKHVLEKSVDSINFKKEIDLFTAINKNVSTRPHADAVIVPLGNRVMVNGDIHGDMEAFAGNLMHATLFYNLLNANGELANGSSAILTGDIGDRGQDDVQCWSVLLELANKNQSRVIIVRGNHEYDQIASIYGFKDRFSKIMPASAWSEMETVWSKLPHFVLFGIQTPNADFYDFIMGVHAAFDPNWDMHELMDTTIANRKNVVVWMDLPANVKAINYNWSDLIPADAAEAAMESQRAAKVTPGMRGAGEDRLNHALVRQYCRNVSTNRSKSCPHSYCLSAILRGHSHNAVQNIGNIGKLIDNPVAPWKALTAFEQYPLSENFDVYTFMTARNIPTVDSDHNWNAYGLIEAGMNGRWYLTPIKFS